MRIIAGRLGGRILTIPKTSATRPMTDKVRGALFNILGPIDGWVVLDAYAGSGAVGIEALSRGASQVTAVDMAKSAVATITKNRQTLGLEAELEVLAVGVEQLPARLAGRTFNLIIADPPYAAINDQILAQLSQLLSPDGRMVVSHSSRIDPPTLESMQRLETRTYGDSSLSFYRNS